MVALQTPRVAQDVIERGCEYSRCHNRFFVSRDFMQEIDDAENLPEHERYDALRALYGLHGKVFRGANGDVYCSERCYDLKYGE
jgi:hypothetical protein